MPGKVGVFSQWTFQPAVASNLGNRVLVWNTVDPPKGVGLRTNGVVLERSHLAQPEQFFPQLVEMPK